MANPLFPTLFGVRAVSKTRFPAFLLNWLRGEVQDAHAGAHLHGEDVGRVDELLPSSAGGLLRVLRPATLRNPAGVCRRRQYDPVIFTALEGGGIRGPFRRSPSSIAREVATRPCFL